MCQASVSISIRTRRRGIAAIQALQLLPSLKDPISAMKGDAKQPFFFFQQDWGARGSLSLRFFLSFSLPFSYYTFFYSLPFSGFSFFFFDFFPSFLLSFYVFLFFILSHLSSFIFPCSFFPTISCISSFSLLVTFFPLFTFFLYFYFIHNSSLLTYRRTNSRKQSKPIIKTPNTCRP